MTRAASGPELRWRSCAALPRRTSPTFETLWSSTRVIRMLSRSPNPSLCVYTFTYIYNTYVCAEYKTYDPICTYIYIYILYGCWNILYNT